MVACTESGSTSTEASVEALSTTNVKVSVDPVAPASSGTNSAVTSCGPAPNGVPPAPVSAGLVALPETTETGSPTSAPSTLNWTAPLTACGLTTVAVTTTC